MKFNFDKLSAVNPLNVMAVCILVLTIWVGYIVCLFLVSPWFLAALPLAALARVLYVTYEPSKD
jgi:hypothetical protein